MEGPIEKKVVSKLGLEVLLEEELANTRTRTSVVCVSVNGQFYKM